MKPHSTNPVRPSEERPSSQAASRRARGGAWRRPGPRTLLLRPRPLRPIPTTALGWTRGDRVGLVGALWRQLHGTPPPALDLGRDAGGHPLLLGPDAAGHALSFSHGSGGLWGALCRGPGLGIDLAGERDFPPDYPWGSAFAPGELAGLALFEASRGGQAALAWSLKEAAVKALGHGFGVVDPRHVDLRELGRSGPWLVARCGLAGVSMLLGRRLGRQWLSLAWRE